MSGHKPAKIGVANVNLKILYKSNLKTFSQSSQKSVKVVPKFNYCTFKKFEAGSEQNFE